MPLSILPPGETYSFVFDEAEIPGLSHGQDMTASRSILQSSFSPAWQAAVKMVAAVNLGL